jgi:hypothetical protein
VTFLQDLTHFMTKTTDSIARPKDPATLFKKEKRFLWDSLHYELEDLVDAEKKLFSQYERPIAYYNDGSFKPPANDDEEFVQDKITEFRENKMNYWANYFYLSERELHRAGDRLLDDGHYFKAITLQLIEGSKLVLMSWTGPYQARAYHKAHETLKLNRNS